MNFKTAVNTIGVVLEVVALCFIIYVWNLTADFQIFVRGHNIMLMVCFIATIVLVVSIVFTIIDRDDDDILKRGLMKFWRTRKTALWVVAAISLGFTLSVAQMRQRDKVDAVAMAEGKIPSVTIVKTN